MTCKFTTTDQPRVLIGRHGDACTIASAVLGDEECPGCLPCTDRHCRVCGRVHAITCPECQAEARDNLHQIAELCGALPAEAASRGVNGEAMMLLGPAADPEAWRNRATSALWGRLDDAYLEDCRDEQHPLWVLGTWEQLWREHLDQATDLTATLPRLVDYLDRQLHVMAEEQEVPFEDFARDLRGCRGHLEDVLHDGEQVETGAPCMTCNVPLRLHRGATEDQDFWQCPRCRQRSTVAQYLFAVQHHYRANADALTASDIFAEYNVPEGSVRAWASEKVGKVRKRGKDAKGLQLYDVADVLTVRDGVAS